jgi:hypothetical protein
MEMMRRGRVASATWRPMSSVTVSGNASGVAMPVLGVATHASGPAATDAPLPTRTAKSRPKSRTRTGRRERTGHLPGRSSAEPLTLGRCGETKTPWRERPRGRASPTLAADTPSREGFRRHDRGGHSGSRALDGPVTAAGQRRLYTGLPPFQPHPGRRGPLLRSSIGRTVSAPSDKCKSGPPSRSRGRRAASDTT